MKASRPSGQRDLTIPKPQAGETLPKGETLLFAIGQSRQILGSPLGTFSLQRLSNLGLGTENKKL